MSRKRVAIIGAGPSGLTAIKACKEEDVEPVCFERNGEPGGLWRYHDEDIEGVASVMKTTIINTSKEISAFSDFPPPKEFPNYMHNSKMLRYFLSYAEKFDLLKHIRYNKEIVKVIQAEDFERTGCWMVTVKDTKTGDVQEEKFDGVMVCIGHHVYPNIPHFAGEELFKGKIIHTHSLKHCEIFAGMRVVVVGIGNSAVDAAVDATFVAKQVYLSTRRGSWIFGRVGRKGKPFDIEFLTRWNVLRSKFASYDIVCSFLERQLNQNFDHAAYNLKPKHRVLSAHPTMNDALPNCILSGRVIVKGDIDRFVESGIIFKGENEVTEVDAVVLATGYQIKFPFLPENLVSTKENKIHLYKYSFPPGLAHPTLAMIGLFQPLGAIFPLSEIQSRWFMQIFTKKLQLPSVEVMLDDIRQKNEENAKRYVESTRHTIQVDFIPFLDEIASEMGVKPNLLKMALTDPKLFWTCFTGPCLSYQYRLQGPHKWPGARDAILSYEERMYTPLNTRKDALKEIVKERSVDSLNLKWLIYVAVLFAVLWKLYA